MLTPDLNQEISDFLDLYGDGEAHLGSDVKSGLLNVRISAAQSGTPLPPAYFVFVGACERTNELSPAALAYYIENLLDQFYAKRPMTPA